MPHSTLFILTLQTRVLQQLRKRGDELYRAHKEMCSPSCRAWSCSPASPADADGEQTPSVAEIAS